MEKAVKLVWLRIRNSEDKHDWEGTQHGNSYFVMCDMKTQEKK